MTGQIARTDTLVPAERLSDRLAALLASRIESGELKPNDRLPTEQELAERHGVSRTVVREAVSRLKSMGMLISRQGSGVFVAPQAAARPLAFDPAVLHSLEAVVQVVEVRRALEGEVAALAARRATPEQLVAIQQALQAIDDAVARGGDGVDEDLLFHRCVATATGNPQFPKRVVCIGSKNVGTDKNKDGALMRDVPEHVEILAEFPSGLTMVLAASTVAAKSPGFAIYGHMASLEIGNAGERLKLMPELPFTEEIDIEEFNGLTPAEDIGVHHANWFNAIRTGTLLRDADLVVVRFGEKYKQWNAAFDAGRAAALAKPLVTLHPPEHDHALKEIDGAALAVCREPEQVVAILRYVIRGEL